MKKIFHSNNANSHIYHFTPSLSCDHRKVNNILKQLSLKLERKWQSSTTDHDGWDYRNAASQFHEVTGCPLDSANRYFAMVEDLAEWKSILGREATIKDRVYCIGSYRVRLP